MKRILLLFVAIMATVSASAQALFTLTESGLVSTVDPNAGYVVVEKPGISQKELFDQVKAFATQFYASPKDVISESATDMITLNGISTKDIMMKKGFGVLDITMNYTIVFMFKDGKIRIDDPSINRMTSESRTIGGALSGRYMIRLTKDSPLDSGYISVEIFNKGKVKDEIKACIESFFNTLIDKAVNFKAPQQENW